MESDLVRVVFSWLLLGLWLYYAFSILSHLACKAHIGFPATNVAKQVFELRFEVKYTHTFSDLHFLSLGDYITVVPTRS